MKIYFNRALRRNTAWGGGSSFLTNMHDYLVAHGETISYSLNERDIDVIFMIDPRYDDGGGCSINEIIQYKKLHPKVKILHRINECDKRNNSANNIDKLLLESNKFADETVFISSWLKDYFHNKGLIRQSNVIMNGCDEKVFYPDNNKSFQSPLRLTTHHWSNNFNKGHDVYRAIDELLNKRTDIEFTYIGRYYEGYQPKNTKIIAPLYGQALGDELRKHDVYVNTSKWEPCGMSWIEGSSCGLPVLYHQDGGGIVEGCKNHGVVCDVNNIESAIDEIVVKYDELRNKIDYDYLSSDRCCKEYYEILKSMV
jgi:hypothetical protein